MEDLTKKLLKILIYVLLIAVLVFGVIYIFNHKDTKNSDEKTTTEEKKDTTSDDKEQETTTNNEGASDNKESTTSTSDSKSYSEVSSVPNTSTSSTNNTTSNSSSKSEEVITEVIEYNWHIVEGEESVSSSSSASVSNTPSTTTTTTTKPSTSTTTATTPSTSTTTPSTSTTTTPSTTTTTTTPSTTTTTTTKPSTTTTTTTTPVKNGWITENGKKYYYKNGKKLTNTYVDYYYLNSKGVRQDKIGSFSATLYGARAWANQILNIRSSANSSSAIKGTVKEGGKVTILGAENSSTKYIKIKYSGITGYVYSDYLMINLPDVIPDMYYEITNASASIYKSAGYSISGITGKNLYGFTKKYNSKISKDAYYVPLLYPVAKQLQKAYKKAKSENYNLKVYDSYRPYSVTKTVYNKFLTLYNNNGTVRNKINYDKNGAYWGPGWFLAQNASNHNKGIAVDIALTKSNGKDLKAQSAMHTLDTTSVVKYNNSAANKLRSIMTSVGFETLQSEWWHFEEANYKGSNITSYKVS